MKRVLFLTAVLILALGACKKSSVGPAVYGKWELRHQSGGWGADSAFQAGNGNIYQFARNNTYKKYDRGVLTAQGKFSVRHDDGYHPEALYVIYFDKSTSGDPVGVNGTTLTIGTSVADGIQSDYVKISD